MNTQNTSAIILAAGRSQRMHKPKALLSFDARQTFIEKITGIYFQWGCSEIILVVNQEVAALVKQLELMPPGVSLIINEHLEWERFYSLKLGLEAVKSSGYCFFQNADNPFIDHEVLTALFENKSDDAFVSPVFGGKGGHPVLLNRKNMDLIRTYHVNDGNLKSVMSTMDCKKVEMPDSKVLININSPEEYERFFDI